MDTTNIEHGWIGTEDRDWCGEEKFLCQSCGEPIHYGDEYYEIFGETICCECVNGWKKEA